ncbi:hypothetical protein EV193_105293 [Herbihabitans rhizosphaerae]|uniref:Uncharacterized protein n=1 Tax=Herbihabitans rhizosphaerae TaxID=1872711 RepID=A0A4Q7KMG5_9PSEU|nr:hypothetical protein [Herbihabitans rhizosphaerae]RZS37735.1 hypothetical protein EV193_105293 [Herbihabitans rhizosphaerae]
MRKRALAVGDRAWYLIFLGAFAITTLVNTGGVRTALVGTAPPDPAGALAALAVFTLIAVKSLWRKGFLWRSAADLTWADFLPGTRERVLYARLVWAGVWRLGLLAYAGAVLARTHEVPPAHLAVVVSVGGAALLVALDRGRRAVPTAGRAALVHAWGERVVRSVALSFLDPMMMLPPAGRVSLGGRVTALRLAVIGVLSRARYLVDALVLAVVVVIVHRVFPALSPTWPVAIAGYLALVPFGGGLADLWRNPGRRRWLSGSDTAIRVTHGALIALVGAVWTALVLAGCAIFGQGLAMPHTLLVMLVVSAAVVRTVARPMPSYDDLMIVDVGFGLVPMRLVVQTVRGPDVALLGVLILSGAGLLESCVVAALVVAVCVLR